MTVTKSKRLLFSMALLATLLFSGSANAQKGFDLPDFDPPPREVVEECAVYEVHFAAPVRTGYMVVNDRKVERGPYNSYEEAYEAGMEQWWIVFEIEEVELPQTWFYWATFDNRAEARNECVWFDSLGFDSKIKTIWKVKLKDGSIQEATMRP